MSKVRNNIPSIENAALARDNEVATQIAQLERQLKEQREQLKALQNERKNSLRLAVDARNGKIEIKGHNGRYATSLYADQWKRLATEVMASGKLDAFIEANKASLKTSKK